MNFTRGSAREREHEDVRETIASEVVARRVRALLQKTTENGATEAEALAAAAKARELMDQYRLTMTDVEVQEEEIVEHVVDRQYEIKRAPVDCCWRGIERYCGIRTYMTTRRVDGRRVKKHVFIGFHSDVAMAEYLYKMLGTTISREARDHAGNRWSFQLGMAYRINDRLIEMAKMLEPTAVTKNGTALVVVRGAVVNRYYDDLAMRLGLRPGGSATHHVDGDSYRAGQSAGNRVNLSRPVGGGSGRLALR